MMADANNDGSANDGESVYGVEDEVRRLRDNDPTLTVADFGCIEVEEDDYDPWSADHDESIISIANALEGNTHVTELRMHDLPVAVGEAGAKALMRALMKNRSIVTIDIEQVNFVGEHGFGALLLGLRNNKQVRKLRIVSESMMLGEVENDLATLFTFDVRVLSLVLKINDTIEELDFSTNAINDEKAQILAEGLKQNQSVKNLFTTHNFLGVIGADALCEAIEDRGDMELGVYLHDQMVKEEHNALRRLMNRRVNFIGGGLRFYSANAENFLANEGERTGNLIDAGAAFADAVGSGGSKNHINYLCLCGVPIFDNDKSLQIAGSALASAGVLTKLDQFAIQIGDTGASLLAKAFRRNTSLQDIRLSNCGIGDVGAEALSEAFRRSSAISRLEMTCYRHREDTPALTDQGAKAIAAWVRGNPNLQELCLQGNYIGDAGAASLAEAISGRTAPFECLNLSKNQIFDAEGHIFARLLQSNAVLKCLRLDENPLDVKAIESISNALKTNHSLAKLHLTYVKVPDSKAQFALIDMLNHNHGLAELFFPTVDVTWEQEVQAKTNASILDALNQTLLHNHTLSVIPRCNLGVCFFYRLVGGRLNEDDASKTDTLLAMNEKGPIIAAAMKGASFPGFLVKDIPDAVVPAAMARISKRDGLSCMYSFVKETNVSITSRVKKVAKKRKADSCS